MSVKVGTQEVAGNILSQLGVKHSVHRAFDIFFEVDSCPVLMGSIFDRSKEQSLIERR